MEHDSPIGAKFLHLGLGYGDNCLPNYVTTLIVTLKCLGHNAELFGMVHRIINRHQMTATVRKLQSVLDLRADRIVIWGHSSKLKTSDIGQAPALNIITDLQTLGQRFTLLTRLQSQKQKGLNRYPFF